MNDPAPDEDRVLLLSPTARDAATARAILEEAGLSCRPCGSLAEVCGEIPRGAGVVVVPEEAVLRGGTEPLAAALRGQPPWSDLPVLVLTAAGRTSDARLRRVLELDGVTLLKRPLDVAEFLSAVRAALRDRRRQYQARAYTDELARQAEALREADRRKDEFLAMLAHELRNPLAPIRNALQILKMPRVDEATAGRSRDVMERQVHHLVRLVDDLLDVSRVMRGKIELRRERVELAAVVARAVETVQPLVDARRHELSVRLPPEPLPLDADPVRLAQVVGNLLTNAARYTEPGGRIRLAAERSGGEAVLRVRDDGIGIAPDVLPHVFELFVQADHAAARAQGGLGVGLTLVKNLVGLHGGSVEAHSGGPGEGSEFVVRLPLAAPGGGGEPAGGGAEPAPPPGRRLLVVDDNVDAADSLAVLLRLRGHEVRVAYGGAAALEAAEAYTPDVVFLDIGMPGMDGYEVARLLRRRPGLGGVVLAALTGWGQEEDRRRTADAGFDHHLVKPVDPEAVAAVLVGVKGRNG
jgi:signal transduction histidine kinase